MLARIISTKKGLNVVNAPLKKAIKLSIKPIMYLFPDKLIHWLYERMCQLSSNNNKEFLSSFASSYSIKKETYFAKDFEGFTLSEFEGFMHPIPIGSHRILSQVFGNYMQLPPLDKQKGHDLVEVDLGKYASWLNERKISELI
jgi:lipopolysaccharide cholinephosphotransferase